MSGGRRQPSLLPREECGAAAGEEGWRSRCRDKAGPAPDQPAREAAGAAAGTVIPGEIDADRTSPAAAAHPVQPRRNTITATTSPAGGEHPLLDARRRLARVASELHGAH